MASSAAKVQVPMPWSLRASLALLRAQIQFTSTGSMQKKVMDLIAPYQYLALEKSLDAYCSSSQAGTQEKIDRFESAVRGAIVPSGYFSDVESSFGVSARHEQNNRFQAWVRRAWLRKRYGDKEDASSAYAKAHDHLKQTSMSYHPRKDSVLPSLQLTKDLFDIHHWVLSPLDKEQAHYTSGTDLRKSNKKSSDRKYKQRRLSAVHRSEKTHQMKLAREVTAHREQNSNEDLYIGHWTFEDILEAGGCSVVGRSAFNVYCEEEGIYEYFTSDYVEALGRFLHTHADELRRKNALSSSPSSSGTVVLEIGAGSGALSHALQQYNAKVNRNDITVVATDSGAWGLSSKYSSSSKVFPVENITGDEALKTFQPDIVIASWMPMNVDWTDAFRKSPSVNSYLLIGETGDNDGCCGHNWKTWGNPKYMGEGSDVTKPFEAEGFLRTDLHHLSALQLSRYDCAANACNSHTVCFSRK